MEADKILAVRTSKTVYLYGDRVIKVFDEDYSKADVLSEALNQALVEETGLCIPKVYEVSKPDGKWAITSEYIEGKTLAQLMHEYPERTTEYLELFVDLQMETHKKLVPALKKLKDQMTLQIREADLDAVTRNGLYSRLDCMPRHDKLCHGDFNPSNIIIRPDGTPYLLDWSHAMQGNASADVAKTYLLFCLDGETDTAEAYLELFCKKSGTVKRYVRSWLPLVAAVQSVKARQEQKPFLHSLINLVDYE